jgi:hypothetical protein
VLSGGLELRPSRVGSEPFDVYSKDLFLEESSVSPEPAVIPQPERAPPSVASKQEQRSDRSYDHCRKYIEVCFLQRLQNVHGCVEVEDEVVGPGCAESLLGEGAPTDGDTLHTGGFGGRDVEGRVADVCCFFPRDVTE